MWLLEKKVKWDETLNLVLAILGTGIAIYQWAVINEKKKRHKELQYLLAGVSNAALSKGQAWINQISLIPPPQNESDLLLLRVHGRAKDDLLAIHSLVSALEGVIDPESSAITDILGKTLRQGELNNRIQQVALENPARQQNQVNAGQQVS